MEEKLREVFCRSRYEPTCDLAEDAWQKICLHNKRVETSKLFIFFFIGTASVVAFIPAIKSLSTDFIQSGFYEYVSLSFSLLFRSGSITTYWKESLLSIAESIPLMSTLLSLVIIFIFCISLKNTMKQITKTKILSF